MNNGMKLRYFDTSNYDFYVKQYIDLSIKNNKPISSRECVKYGLPHQTWYINHCPDENVTTWGKFVNWCGFFNYKSTPKKRAIELIYQMAKKCNRPLMYDDFRNPGCYEVSINYINKHWGSINKMKKDLGLEITRESMTDRFVTKDMLDEAFNIIENVCKLYFNNVVSNNIIKNIPELKISITSIFKKSIKYYNKSMYDILRERGLKVGKSGCGNKYIFEDGEETLSQYEFLFSKLLRKNGFKYNKDYFRDVKYSSFITCDKNYSCDYVLHYKNRIIYIEIPGILDEYKTWYYDNKTIKSSKHKEYYKNKLKEKEKLLRDNDLEYYFLFPTDITQNNLSDIINDTNGTRERIESEYKNNIDWNAVIEIGELQFYNKVGRDGQKIVNYE